MMKVRVKVILPGIFKKTLVITISVSLRNK